MIIRQDRQKLIELIHSYMDEKITAFQLDDELCKLGTSQDKTVEWVTNKLWYFYDDCKNHKIVASKKDWDFFWRCLLLLESNAEVNIKETWHWRASQLLHFDLFCLFFGIAYYMGWGCRLMAVAVIFGAAGLLLRKFTRIENNFNATTCPFSSFSEIRTARKGVPSFSKQRYPKCLVNRTIRGRFLEATVPGGQALLTFLSMFLSPFFLLYDSLPQSQTQVSVVASPSSAV